MDSKNEETKPKKKRFYAKRSKKKPKVTTRAAFTNTRPQELLTPTIQLEDETVRDILLRSKEYYNKKNKFPDELKVLAIVLRSAGYSLKKISGVIGASSNRIGEWIHAPHFDSFELSRIADGIKERMRSRLIIDSQTAFSAAMTDEKLNKASYLQLITGASIKLDKHLLLSNQATERVEHIYYKKDELGTKRDELSQEIIDVEAEIIKLEDQGVTLDNVDEGS